MLEDETEPALDPEGSEQVSGDTPNAIATATGESNGTTSSTAELTPADSAQSSTPNRRLAHIKAGAEAQRASRRKATIGRRNPIVTSAAYSANKIAGITNCSHQDAKYLAVAIPVKLSSMLAIANFLAAVELAPAKTRLNRIATFNVLMEHEPSLLRGLPRLFFFGGIFELCSLRGSDM